MSIRFIHITHTPLNDLCACCCLTCESICYLKLLSGKLIFPGLIKWEAAEGEKVSKVRWASYTHGILLNSVLCLHRSAQEYRSHRAALSSYRLKEAFPPLCLQSYQWQGCSPFLTGSLTPMCVLLCRCIPSLEKAIIFLQWPGWLQRGCHAEDWLPAPFRFQLPLTCVLGGNCSNLSIWVPDNYMGDWDFIFIYIYV